MVQEKPNALQMRVTIQMINSFGIEHRSAAFYTMDDVSLAQKKLGQICAVLTRNAGYKCNFLHLFSIN
jgi:hypothetical protein